MTTERTNWPEGMMLRHSRAARYQSQSAKNRRPLAYAGTTRDPETGRFA